MKIEYKDILYFIRETGKMRIYKICYVFHTFNTTALQDPLNGQVKGLTSQIGKGYAIFLTKVHKYMMLLQSACLWPTQ